LNCADPAIGILISQVGERIKRLRNDVLMTQDDLAAAAGVSTDLIRKLEQGQRHTCSIGSLHRIARALGVEVGELLGRARPQRSTDGGQALVLPIRDALTPVDDLTGLIDDDTGVPTVAELGRSVTYGWSAYWGGRYGLLAVMLPDLLAQSRAVLRGAVADRARAIDLAAQVQQLTAGTLLRLGAADLAHTAARESLRLAAGGDDPLRDAAMRSTLTYVLIRQVVSSMRSELPSRPQRRSSLGVTPARRSCRCTGGCCCAGRPRPPGPAAPARPPSC
jgi:transcriptional regulator with XRE-family HTH domain